MWTIIASLLGRNTALADMSARMESVEATLDRVQSSINILAEMVQRMSDTFDANLTGLASDMQGLTTVVGSVTTFIDGLEERLAAALAEAASNGVTPQQVAAVTAIREALALEKSNLANAIVTGTPAAGEATTPRETAAEAEAEADPA